MKKTFYVHWTEMYDRKMHPSLYDADRTKLFPDAVLGIAVDVDVGEPPPRADVVKAQVAALKKEQGELMARFYGIDRQIAELMCIEDKSAEVVES